MKKTTIALMVCMASLAQAAPQDEKVAQASDARCRKDVKDYVETLKFVRQTAGDQIGDRVAKGFVSEEELSKTVVARGSCAGAQMLKERGVTR